MTAPTYYGSASSPADNGSATEPNTATITPPASMAAGDLAILIGQNGAAATGQITISNAGGQTWNLLGETAANAQCISVWWCEFNGTWSANPALDFAAQTGTLPTTAVLHVFRPGSATETWAVDQAYQAAGFSAPANADYGVSRAGQTPTQNNAVTLVGWFSADDNTWGDPYIADVDQYTGVATSGAVSGIAGGTGTSSQTNPTQAVGQSFTTVEAINLQAILLDFSKNGSPSDNVYIELMSDSITGTAIATSDNVAASGVTSSTQVTFNFSSPPSLSAATKYWFRVLRSGSRDTTNYLACRYHTSSVHSGGGAFNRTNNSWSSESGSNDIRFTIVPTGPTFTTTGSAQYRNGGGADQSCSFAHCIQASSPVYTHPVWKRQTALGGDAGVAFIVTFYSQVTSADGTGNVTGVSSTGSAGTVSATGAAQGTVTGVSSTTGVGTLTANVSNTATFSGVSSTGSSGTVTATGDASTTVTGVSSSSSAGTVTANVSNTATFSGVQGTGQVGTITATGDAAAAFSGVQAVGGVGTTQATGDAQVTPTGVAATGQAGTVSANTSVEAFPSGVSSTTAAGDIAATGNASATLTGVSTTGSAGNVTANVSNTATFVGVESTGGVGTLTANVSNSAFPTGVSSTGSAGSPTATGEAVANVTGVSSSGNAGTVAATASAQASLTGVSSATTAGTVSASGDATATLTGNSSAGAAGTVTANAVVEVTAYPTGVSATGSSGTITATADATATVEGGVGTGQVGSITAYSPTIEEFTFDYSGAHDSDEEEERQQVIEEQWLGILPDVENALFRAGKYKNRRVVERMNTLLMDIEAPELDIEMIKQNVAALNKAVDIHVRSQKVAIAAAMSII